jgi:Fe-S-cluster containining protein
MAPLPWKQLNSWFCQACGLCCRDNTPLLTTLEGIRFSKKFGGVIEPCVRGFILKKGSDGRCVFQYYSGQRWLCSIQGMKPQACKLWPFMVCRDPTYGRAGEALYAYADDSLYVYVNAGCGGINYGIPSHEYISKIIPEFIEISLGLHNRQFFSTHRSTLNIPLNLASNRPSMHRYAQARWISAHPQPPALGKK